MDRDITVNIINKIFRKPDLQFGLTEFEKTKPSEVLSIFEKEKGKYY
ncbi:MAG: hypothetical protein UR98_C0001G0002 [Parcubacteria group bacterium GW2011_GWA1_36_12]|nr:MAG: hypothetical protein UR98_C0001G0002 [Parcubacteria group bacterium GW2011_GWA1_36_12]